ncbi:MAG: hypothetical protein Q8L47_00300 [bacterium]|nr:hypothetical protein [bacterium]
MIEKISVPDDDMPGWIKLLHESNITDEEIDRILTHLNETYADKSRETTINKELRKMEAEVINRRGSEFTPDEKKTIREGIETRFERRVSNE